LRTQSWPAPEAYEPIKSRSQTLSSSVTPPSSALWSPAQGFSKRQGQRSEIQLPRPISAGLRERKKKAGQPTRLLRQPIRGVLQPGNPSTAAGLDPCCLAEHPLLCRRTRLPSTTPTWDVGAEERDQHYPFFLDSIFLKT
jgi:hypothetical protein